MPVIVSSRVSDDSQMDVDPSLAEKQALICSSSGLDQLVLHVSLRPSSSEHDQWYFDRWMPSPWICHVR